MDKPREETLLGWYGDEMSKFNIWLLKVILVLLALVYLGTVSFTYATDHFRIIRVDVPVRVAQR